ncbi:MAG TPA: hypothetical protein VJT84_10270 [Gaiellaceae bacterium]|nr:hypothetical protein [Gaiellaceae bacterium]
MYATIRSYSGSTDLVDALLDHQNDIRQLINGIGGFRAYYLVRTGGGNALTISVFDDEGGAEESTRLAAGWIRDNLSDLSVTPPQVTSGEVALSF